MIRWQCSVPNFDSTPLSISASSRKRKGNNARSANASRLLDGRAVADQILQTVAREVKKLQTSGVQPKLAFFLVGENPASMAYVKQKEKACEQTGIAFLHLVLPETVTTETLVEQIEALNARSDVHGILVQLPLPAHIQTPLVLRAMDPKKDVDGFHVYNVGKMTLSTEFESLIPATPKGVIRLLEHYKIPIESQEVVVVGHSNLVGKPLSIMFLNRNATVTTCHKFTKDLASHTRRADILAVGVGKPNLITADMVKPGAVVVDIGINRVDDKLVGDVDFEGVAQVASHLTPVPGGVGPMTVACLMENVVLAARRFAAR